MGAAGEKRGREKEWKVIINGENEMEGAMEGWEGAAGVKSVKRAGRK